jgi:hypothetical protein
MQTIALLVLINVKLVLSLESPLVSLENLGEIRGGYGKSLGGDLYYSFEGVSYANPPVGQHRFEVCTKEQINH